MKITVYKFLMFSLCSGDRSSVSCFTFSDPELTQDYVGKFSASLWKCKWGNWQGVFSPSGYIRSFQTSQKRVFRGKKTLLGFPSTNIQWIYSTNMQWKSLTNIQWIFQTGEHRGWGIEEHLSWRTGEHLHGLYLFHVIQTHSMFSDPGFQDPSNEGLVDILLFCKNIHLVPKMKWAKRTKWIARISLQNWQRSRNNNGDWFTFSLCQKV